jgi:GntR family transcriptional repressor for pyruvate dehydrogenase complex
MLHPPTRSKLSAQIFDALVGHILEEDLQPGDVLPSTAELSARFETSRPIVREALSAIQAIGLVDISAGKNATIRGVDGHLVSLFLTQALRSQQRPMSALMEIRGPLEVECSGLAALRAEPHHLDSIRRALAEMDAAKEDSDRYPILDIAFHSAIAGATENTALTLVTDALRTQLVEVMFRVREYREQNQIVGGEHEDHLLIATAIEARDVGAAREAMTRHMTTSAKLVRELESAI